VLDSVVAGDGGQPGQVDRVTIGFDAVAALAAGKVDAATAFWNAEGVTLERRGVPTRVFRVDDFGAPRYPELVLCTSDDELKTNPHLVDAVRTATQGGYTRVVADPDAALSDLLDGVNGLDESEQRAQLEALMRAHAFEPVGSFDEAALNAWAGWDFEHGLVKMQPDLTALFPQL